MSITINLSNNDYNTTFYNCKVNNWQVFYDLIYNLTNIKRKHRPQAVHIISKSNNVIYREECGFARDNDFISSTLTVQDTGTVGGLKSCDLRFVQPFAPVWSNHAVSWTGNRILVHTVSWSKYTRNAVYTSDTHRYCGHSYWIEWHQYP